MTATQEIHRTGLQRELPCKLKQHEWLEIAVKKSRLEDELEEVKEQFDQVKEQWKKRITEIEDRIAVHRVELRTGEQKRVVECFERWKGQVIEIVRDDTGEVIDSRTASLRDTQQQIPGTEEDEAAQADAAATQRSAGVAEDEDGDVIPIESNGSGRPKKKKK